MPEPNSNAPATIPTTPKPDATAPPTTPVGTAPTTTPPPPETAPTTLLAGKYKTPADLESAYKALESKLGEMSAFDPDISTEALLAKADLKAPDLMATFQKDGKLTDEQYAKLAKIKWTKSAANEVISANLAIAQAQRANVEASKAEIVKMVGGQTQLDNLMISAGNFLTEAEKPAIQAQLNNPATAKLAIGALMARHAQSIGAGGSQPLVNGGIPATAALAATSLKEFNQLVKAARAGDAHARARVAATPESMLQQM